MIVDVTKKVTVEITQQDVMSFRKINPGCTQHGPLSVDENIIQILADTKATDMINSRSALVKTGTSIDGVVTSTIVR